MIDIVEHKKVFNKMYRSSKKYNRALLKLYGLYAEHKENCIAYHKYIGFTQKEIDERIVSRFPEAFKQTFEGKGDAYYTFRHLP